jgi:hypothetical protein
MSNATLSNTTVSYDTVSKSPAKQPGRRSGRPAIVAVMIASLLASVGARIWADARRDAASSVQGTPVGTTSLGGMNSYALGLLLGGLRGPLVMFLWSQSENQKSEKDLEGLDTMIEWIRLLQPEFDSVHIFQIWNKAYNISVQMASKANKYDVILGALDYADKVDRARPDDINIVAAMGQLYFDKFGNSTEKEYYRKRVREETLPHAVIKQNQGDPGWRRMQLDPLLDNSFNVLTKYTTPRSPDRVRPANLPADQEWDDGTAMQYLPRFEPYPDGVSPLGIAYNYYKRAEVLQNVEKQHHDQWSDAVIDTRPALALKNWGEAELEQGHRREVQGFDGLANPSEDDPDELISNSADVSLNQKIRNLQDIHLAMAAFDHARKILPACLEEYDRHFKLFPQPEMVRQAQNYMLEVRVETSLANADYEFLAGMLNLNGQRDNMLAKATADYTELRRMSYIMMLKYYVPLDILAKVLPPGFAREKTADLKPLEDLTLEQASAAMEKADRMIEDVQLRTHRNPIDQDSRIEFERFISRALYREAAIRGGHYVPAPKPIFNPLLPLGAGPK